MIVWNFCRIQRMCRAARPLSSGANSWTTPDRLSELMDIGWLKPTRTAEAALLFRQDDVYRIRKLERLCSDFELHTLGGSIVMDLLDRIATLELRIRELTDR